MTRVYADRRDAGRRLAKELGHLAGRDVVVVGLPRGGVPVAFEVARALGAPLDVIVVRKIGVPSQPELAMGALGEGGVRVVDEDVVRTAAVTADQFAAVERMVREELERRSQRLRGSSRLLPLAGRVAVVVDDGLATGSTARAACQVARARGAVRVVLAAPVAPPETVQRLRSEADEVVVTQTPHNFFNVGQWYVDFTPTSDAEVTALLDQARAAPQPAGRGDRPPVQEREINLVAGGALLAGQLTTAPDARGLVIFAHGSGSSRHSPRNRAVASLLNRAGLSTLLFDLLTRDEEPQRARVFDIGLLADRLGSVTRQTRAGHPWVGYFGASTGAAAALWAAAEPGADVAAVVSRGGRPDLAMQRLGQLRAPTLLIVGGDDEAVLDLNRIALARLRCPCELAIVPGAGHLFEEPGTLDTAAARARDWFLAHGGPTREEPRGEVPKTRR
ncbi:MAG: phosphoribosyltransferase [Actinobacteria bacterium]|nr:phosphoribosyltransferase [Actinomycetota bacterium]